MKDTNGTPHVSKNSTPADPLRVSDILSIHAAIAYAGTETTKTYARVEST